MILKNVLLNYNYINKGAAGKCSITVQLCGPISSATAKLLLPAIVSPKEERYYGMSSSGHKARLAAPLKRGSQLSLVLVSEGKGKNSVRDKMYLFNDIVNG